jgi:hypothetical protein
VDDYVLDRRRDHKIFPECSSAVRWHHSRPHYPPTATGQHVSMYRRKVTYWRPTEVGWWWFCCRCLVTPLLPREKALAMQHAKHIRRDVWMSSLVWRVYRIPSYYLIKWTICGTKLLGIKCVFWFLYDLETFFFVRTLQRDIAKHVHMSACEAHDINVRF